MARGRKPKNSKNKKATSKDDADNHNSTELSQNDTEIEQTVSGENSYQTASVAMADSVATAKSPRVTDETKVVLKSPAKKRFKAAEEEQVVDPDFLVLNRDTRLVVANQNVLSTNNNAQRQFQVTPSRGQVSAPQTPKQLEQAQLYQQYDRMRDDFGDGVEVGISQSDEDRFGDSDDDLDLDTEQPAAPSRIPARFRPSPGKRSAVSADSEVFFNKREMLRKDPEVLKMVDELVKEKMKNQVTGAGNHLKKAVKVTNNGMPSIKSPSDTTVYAPALLHTPLAGGDVVPKVIMGNDPRNNQQNVWASQIAKFVENIRLDVTDKGNAMVGEQPQQATPGTSAQVQLVAGPGVPLDDNEVQLENARVIANNNIIEAEKFKASVAPLPGMDIDKVNVVPGPVTNASIDDHFFHITCHIEQSLREKIEKGEYVELERLLVKPHQASSYGQRLELVNRDGATYFAPAEPKNNKVNGLKKWEQAFRVYASIYCRANPHRSVEIWQYIHVIHTAAGSYVWDNVAQYDYIFRQLMGAHPERSWANIYQQMWSLSMREPLLRGGGFSYNGNNGNHSSHSQYGGNNMSLKERRRKYCWKFNKNRPHESDCKYEHKCKFCDAPTHGIYICPKKQKKNTENGGAQAGPSGQ